MNIQIGTIVRVKNIRNNGFIDCKVKNIIIDFNCEYGYRYPIKIEFDNNFDYWFDVEGVDADEIVKIEMIKL